MLENPASDILDSLQRGVKRETRVSCGAAALPAERRVSARRGWAGEKSGHFEHPARFTPVTQDLQTGEIQAYSLSFSVASYLCGLTPAGAAPSTMVNRMVPT